MSLRMELITASALQSHLTVLLISPDLKKIITIKKKKPYNYNHVIDFRDDCELATRWSVIRAQFRMDKEPNFHLALRKINSHFSTSLA